MSKESPISSDWIDELSKSAYPITIQAMDDLVWCYNLAVEIQDYINNIWPDLYEKAKRYHGELALKPAEASYEHCLTLNEQIYDKTQALRLMIDDMDYVDDLLFANTLRAKNVLHKLEPLKKDYPELMAEVFDELKEIFNTRRAARIWKYFEEVVHDEDTE